MGGPDVGEGDAHPIPPPAPAAARSRASGSARLWRAAASGMFVPGGNTAAPRHVEQGLHILGGITPPTTIMMSPRPSFRSASLSSGTRVRWPAASDDTPTTWTFPLHASAAASSGVAKCWPISTSKPRSAKAEAIPSARGRARPAPSGDEDLRARGVVLAEGAGHAAHPIDDGVVVAEGARVDARDHLDLGLVAAPSLLQREADLADGRLARRRRPRA